MTPDCLPGGAGEADVDEAGVELQLGEHRAQVRLVVLPGEGGQPAGGQVHDVFSLPFLDWQKISLQVPRLPELGAGPQLTGGHHQCSSSPSQARRDCCARRRPAD